jgi:6-phosphogluconolactonase
MRVYIGTYTQGDSEGIYQFDFDPTTGRVGKPRLAGRAANPPFLAIHPNGNLLCSIGEISNADGTKQGAVNAFSIDAASGELTLLNQQSSRGVGPCHVTVDRSGRFALVTNYRSGSVAVLPIDENGRLKPASDFVQHVGSSVNRERQEGPHAHSVNLDFTNRFAIVCDLGLDQVLVYRFDSDRGTLKPNEPPAANISPGSGPRHFALHPTGRFAYVINELASTVTAFTWNVDSGRLSEIQTISTLPEGMVDPNNSTAEVQVHTSGKFLYGSNRGHDSIAMFAIDPTTGRLTSLGQQPSGGQFPRNFGIDFTGNWLLAAHQHSHTVRVFEIETATGRLRPTDQVVEVPSPVCVKFYRLTN